jgi:phosphoglycerol transferase MdoB-like AlkP superfamily enzyme
MTGDHSQRRHLNNHPTLFERLAVPFVLYGPEVLRGLPAPPPAAGSHLDMVPTLLELCAPKGFEYHSFGRNLLDPSPPSASFGNKAVMTTQFLFALSPHFQIEALPGLTLSQPVPPLDLLTEQAQAFFALSWWRGMKGARLPDPSGTLPLPDSSAK